MNTTVTRTITAVVLAVVLAGCGSSGSDDKATAPTTDTTTATATATATAPPTPSASPSLSQAETARQCSVAVSEAAPGWDDWNFDPGGWQDDPRTPPVCQGLADEEFPPRGNRAFMDALVDGLQMADDPRARQ
jgi:hypothetical protein